MAPVNILRGSDDVIESDDLKPFFPSTRKADRTIFKDILCSPKFPENPRGSVYRQPPEHAAQFLSDNTLRCLPDGTGFDKYTIITFSSITCH